MGCRPSCIFAWRPGGRRRHGTGASAGHISAKEHSLSLGYALSPAGARSKPTVSDASLLPTQERSAHGSARRRTHTAGRAHCCAPDRGCARGRLQPPLDGAFRTGKSPGVAQESGASVRLGGGLCGALCRLVLMILPVVCVCAEKIRDAACLLHLSRAPSLQLSPSLCKHWI